MKHTKYILCLLLTTILSIISCSKSTDTGLLSRLSDIQAMGDSCPLKAILRLDSIKPLFEEESEYARNKMSLLDIRLHDKAFIAHTNDSTIKAVCRFFENQGSARDKQEAYYYMGSVYRDLKDYPNAVTYYLKSNEMFENSKNTDPAIFKVSCIQLSVLYRKQFNYTEALSTMLKGLDAAEKSGLAGERIYMDVASCYYEINDMLNCLLFCNKAISIIENKGIKKENADIVSRAMSLYAAADCHEDSKKCLNLLNSLKENERPRNYLASLSKYCAKYVSKDSAAIIVERIFEKTGNIQELYDASKWLARYYSNKGDYENATKYAMYFIRVNNTLIENRKFEHTTNAKNIFRYQRDKEEELRIIEQGRKDRYYLILGISVSLILLLAGAVIYYRRKKMLLEIILNKENDIKHVKSVVRDKEQELVSLNLKNESLSEQLEHAKDEFKMLVSQNRELTKLSLMNNVPDDAKDIIEKARRTSKGKYRLDDDEWKELLGAIDRMFPEFTYEVQSKFKKISEPVLRVCYLRKIGLSAPEIVNLTDYPRQTVWDRIKRIEMIMEW